MEKGKKRVTLVELVGMTAEEARFYYEGPHVQKEEAEKVVLPQEEVIVQGEARFHNAGPQVQEEEKKEVAPQDDEKKEVVPPEVIVLSDDDDDYDTVSDSDNEDDDAAPDRIKKRGRRPKPPPFTITRFHGGGKRSWEKFLKDLTHAPVVEKEKEEEITLAGMLQTSHKIPVKLSSKRKYDLKRRWMANPNDDLPKPGALVKKVKKAIPKPKPVEKFVTYEYIFQAGVDLKRELDEYTRQSGQPPVHRSYKCPVLGCGGAFVGESGLKNHAIHGHNKGSHRCKQGVLSNTFDPHSELSSFMEHSNTE